MCTYNEKKFLLVDIPGTYSIMSNSEEEEIARNYICFGDSDVVVVIVDATSLERNLNLVYQIMEITDKVVVCVNLLDEAKKKGINIDLKEMERLLGVPVVGTIARKKKTLNRLMDKVAKIANGEIKLQPKTIRYLPYVEDCVENIQEKIEKMLPKNDKRLARWICLKIIDGDSKILKSIEDNLHIKIGKNSNAMLERAKSVNLCIEKNKIKNSAEDTIMAEGYKLPIDTNNSKSVKQTVNDILENNRVKQENVKNDLISSIVFQAENVCKDVVSFEETRRNRRDRKIDKVLTSKVWGIPIMILFLGVIFWITITGANYPSEWLSQFFGWLQGKIEYLFEILSAPEWIKSMLIDGVYKTLTWIIAVMLPPMAIFFPLFTLLEDLGFLPRIAFNLDKFFRKAGSSRQTSTYYVHGIWM